MNQFTWSASEDTPVKLSFFKQIFTALAQGCEALLRNETDIIARVRQLNAEVAIVHVADMCWMGIAEHLGIKHRVWMNTAFLVSPFAWYSGTPNPPSYVDSGISSDFDHKLFRHRTKNAIMASVMNVVFYWVLMRPCQAVHLHYYPKSRNLIQVLKDSRFFYVNSYIAVDAPRPLTPKITMVGGLTMVKAGNLTKEWLDIIDISGEHGVVVFAFGTVANTTYMPEALKVRNVLHYMKFLDAFKRLPQRVIWRLEGEFKPAENVPNIVVKKWIPQKTLLAHPKIKVFISHGGYNSFTEATHAGVPIIAVPLFGDQYRNAKRVTSLGIGLSIDHKSASAEEIFAAIDYVVNSRK
ncbi:unnamed protein product [Soboliphyme baturini]|uniref:glucuronosyltransferase n=1 Tax=Soboliphyme baturini TaxID=241478 RepID=A0A183II25_9BILA|nr:unnamed protein product [Soboliphyme baturini]